MTPTNELIGKSLWARQIRQAVTRVAAYRSSVLVSGPSGTGKELVARAVHNHSPRKGQAFVAVDCTAIPPGLFASQLFGHVKGAFSGADCDTLGCFRAAEGGTIFLDEIGELELELQSQLLRVIQQREVIPVGSHRPVPIDIRLVAATNRELADEVRAGRFRQDLYYRLNVVRLETQPLRERVEDIEPLCQHFLARLAVDYGLPDRKLSRDALLVLAGYAWPGNVRELQNTVERLVIFAQQETIDAEQVRNFLARETPASAHSPNRQERPDFATQAAVQPESKGAFRFAPGEADAIPTLAECEKRLIQAALERSFYNQSAAARLLAIDRKMLARKIRRHQIDVPTGGHSPARATNLDQPFAASNG